MNSIVAVFITVSCLLVAIKAAAVEPVVAELQEENSSNPIGESEISTNEDCVQPKETGRCFALFYRFAYDVEKRKCVEFIYGGCSGNSNNFETKEDCELKCLENDKNSSIDDDDDNVGVLNTTVSPNSENGGSN